MNWYGNQEYALLGQLRINILNYWVSRGRGDIPGALQPRTSYQTPQ